MVGCRDGVLPDEFLGGDFGSEVAGFGSHVAVGEFEPCAGEGVVEFGGVFEEAAGDFLVCGVESQCEVCGEHGGALFFSGVEGVGDVFGCVFGDPLVGTGGAFGEFPFVFEEVFEVGVGPFVRGLGPGDFEAAGDGIGADAGFEAAFPAEPLFFEGSGFWFRADV